MMFGYLLVIQLVLIFCLRHDVYAPNTKIVNDSAREIVRERDIERNERNVVRFAPVSIEEQARVNHKVSVISRGFGGDTLVRVPGGYLPISKLKKGFFVISCDRTGRRFEREVLSLKSVDACSACEFAILNKASEVEEKFVVGEAQRFSLPDASGIHKTWLTQEDFDGGLSYGFGDQEFSVRVRQSSLKENKIFLVEVKGLHNLLITKKDILAHNCSESCCGDMFECLCSYSFKLLSWVVLCPICCLLCCVAANEGPGGARDQAYLGNCVNKCGDQIDSCGDDWGKCWGPCLGDAAFCLCCCSAWRNRCCDDNKVFPA